MRHALEPAKSQAFRSHQRAEFNAALMEAAKHPDAMLTVETDAAGETVATIHYASHAVTDDRETRP